MSIDRIRIEIEEDGKTIDCHYYNYPNPSYVEPTVVIIDGKEYLGEIDIKKDDGYYVVRFKKL